MNSAVKILKNTSILLASYLTSAILGFFYTMVMARYLGPQNYGLIMFAIALTTIALPFTDLGLNNIFLREIARDHSLASKYFKNIISIKLILVSLTFSIVLYYIISSNYSDQKIQVVLIIALSTVINVFIQYYYYIFQAFERMEFVSLGQVISSISIFLGILISQYFKLNIMIFASVFLFSYLVVLIYAVVILKLKFSDLKMMDKITETVDWDFWKKLFKMALPLGIIQIFWTVRLNVSTVMLSSMQGDTAAGLFNAGLTLFNTTSIVPVAVNLAIIPIMARYFLTSKDMFDNLFRKTFKYLLICGLTLALAVSILAKPIIYLVYGQEFTESIVVLQILIWASAVAYIDFLLGTIYFTANRQFFDMIRNLIIVTICIILNFLLIPKYGYIGSALAFLISGVLAIIIGIIFLYKFGHHFNLRKTALPAITGTAVASAAAMILNYLQFNIFLVAFIALILFLIFVYFLVMNDDDKQLIKSIVYRQNLKAVWKKYHL